MVSMQYKIDSKVRHWSRMIPEVHHFGFAYRWFQGFFFVPKIFFKKKKILVKPKAVKLKGDFRNYSASLLGSRQTPKYLTFF